GTDCSGFMYEYLSDNGLSRQEYHWFRDHGRALRPHCVMGSDYYVANEYRVLSGSEADEESLARQQATATRGPFKVPALSGEIGNQTHFRVAAADPTSPAGEVFGYYVICHQYFDRYHLPVMHTETNRKDADAAPAWLWKEWSNILRL